MSCVTQSPSIANGITPAAFSFFASARNSFHVRGNREMPAFAKSDLL